MAAKIALVTGGSSGIGRATALAFAREGAKVVVSDISVDNGEETVRLIQDAGGIGIFVRADMAKATEVEAVVKTAVATYGRLDCAFNNAGIQGDLGAPIDSYSEELWDRVIDVNLKGVWLCLKYEIAQMLKQRSGAVVNTSSVWGLAGGAGVSGYVASKHGVVGLTRAAALEYAQQGIRVNAVAPGLIDTAILGPFRTAIPDFDKQIIARQPLGRIGKPEEIAAAVVWLCSDAASFVTGHIMSVDGGYTAQ